MAIENPANSYMWDLEEARALAAQAGMRAVTFHNCMFRGGQRDKLTTVLTNVEEIADALSNHMCQDRVYCSRTGIKHLTWDPEVVDGVIVKYQTRGEACYPVGLCDAVGAAVAKRRRSHHRQAPGTDIAFTEVFAGPRAILSARVARHVAVGLAGSSSSASSHASRAQAR